MFLHWRWWKSSKNEGLCVSGSLALWLAYGDHQDASWGCSPPRVVGQREEMWQRLDSDLRRGTGAFVSHGRLLLYRKRGFRCSQLDSPVSKLATKYLTQVGTLSQELFNLYMHSICHCFLILAFLKAKSSDCEGEFMRIENVIVLSPLKFHISDSNSKHCWALYIQYLTVWSPQPMRKILFYLHFINEESKGRESFSNMAKTSQVANDRRGIWTQLAWAQPPC